MRFKLVAAAILTLLTGGLVRPLAAQSLGDLSRQEEDRRKNVKEPAKVITNGDLGAPSSEGAPAVSAGSDSSSANAGEAAKDAAKDGKDKAKDSQEPVKDQKYWAGRVKQLQTELDRDQSFSAALQTQINSLATDFVNRDDPAQKAQIEQNRQKALAELSRVNDQVVKDKKAIDDLNDEARRAGVPPGWLR